MCQVVLQSPSQTFTVAIRYPFPVVLTEQSEDCNNKMRESYRDLTVLIILLWKRTDKPSDLITLLVPTVCDVLSDS
jgi:hypothetical protein